MTPEREARRLKRREKTQAWVARVVECYEMVRIQLGADGEWPHKKPTAHQRLRLAAWLSKPQSQRHRFDRRVGEWRADPLALFGRRTSRVQVSLAQRGQSMGALRTAFAQPTENDYIGFDLGSMAATSYTWSQP